VLGSPLYMSPEHLRSARDVDARADVYAIGVVLYELLTARAPFVGGELPQLVYSIMNEPPPPLRAVRTDLPEGMEVAVLQAMARDRDARFSSVADLAVALAPFAPAAARGSVERVCGILRDRDPQLARGLADHPSQAVGTSWSQITVPFSILSTDGAAAPGGFDKAHVYAIEFHASPSEMPFEFWVDDVALYK